jgi:hypothetical protein
MALVNSLFFVSCLSRHSQPEVEKTSVDLSGTWINVSYLMAAEKTKSAMAAYNTFQTNEISLLEIGGKSLPLHCVMTADAHTGGIHQFITRYSQTKFVYDLGDSTNTYYTIRPDFNANDTLLILSDLVAKREQTFRRISKVHVAEPFSFIFNISIFSGKYDILDSLGNKIYSDVVLNKDGTINNLEFSKKYQVWVDYATDPNPSDWIIFDNESLEYEFRGNDIYLFKKTGESEDDLNRGPLKYIMSRQ